MKKEILSSELLIEGNQIISYLENYILHVIQSMDWDLVYSDKIDIQCLLKIAEIRFDDAQETLVEKILDYMRVSSELLDMKCFVFVNLLSYLTEYDIVSTKLRCCSGIFLFARLNFASLRFEV